MSFIQAGDSFLIVCKTSSDKTTFDADESNSSSSNEDYIEVLQDMTIPAKKRISENLNLDQFFDLDLQMKAFKTPERAFIVSLVH